MELGNSHGVITPGLKANFIITKPIPDLEYLVYDFGQNNIHRVMIDGHWQ
jgi:imidazolonepropionase